MILRYSQGLAQLDECPTCGYLVFQTDMQYNDDTPQMCKFCQRDSELPEESETYLGMLKDID